MDRKILLLIALSSVFAFSNGKNVVYDYICICIVKLRCKSSTKFKMLLPVGKHCRMTG
jgi:hypothetical protein